MRDLLVIGLVMAGSLAALRLPWIGALVWAWMSLMNPHRYTYGLAHDAPLAAVAAAATIVGWLATRDKMPVFESTAAKVMGVFMVWMTISWLVGLGPAEDYEQWKKVMKIDVMTLITLALLTSRVKILSLAWVVTLSLALLGVKGGIFTVANGGNYRVWGPPGGFVEDNNEFALALVITIPLLRFLQEQVTVRWLRHGMTAAMLLCAASALGSHSRGGFLAISAMTVVLWWRGTNRVKNGVLFVVLAVVMLAFMPEHWTERMSTIDDFEQDRSALGRISAWWTAYNLAWVYPFGIGFDLARPELFARFSPYPTYVHAAHSIYFLILGNHGWIGLFLFLLLFGIAWQQAGAIRRLGKTRPEWKWCSQLGNMAQVSLVGYAVGGAFLSLAYFDLPYYVMVLVVATRLWMRKEAARDPAFVARWAFLTRWMQWAGIVAPEAPAAAPVPAGKTPLARAARSRPP